MKLLALAACVSIIGAVSVVEKHDQNRQQLVDEINSLPGITWKAGINPRFKGQPIGASKSLCGVKNDTLARRNEKIANGTLTVLKKIEGLAVPDSFDSETNWPKCAKIIGDIRDQSNCGCCWAFGAASAASDRMCIATNGTVQIPLSAQDMCFCGSDNGCDGGYPEDAWQTISAQGLVSGGQNKGLGPFGAGFCSAFSLPHCHHHGPTRDDPYPSEGAPGCPSVTNSPACPTSCDSDAKAPHNSFTKDKYSFKGEVNVIDSDPDAIAQAILTSGPVEAAFTVYSDFENYVSGIYKATTDKQMGGHAIRIVGWGVDGGVKYWKVANSWNPYWGEKGYFRIARGTNECGIEDSCVASGAAVAWTGPGVPIQPTPAPGPPKKGECDLQDTKAACTSTINKQGNKCTWCFLSGLGIGICQDSAVCSTPPSH